MQLPKPFHHLIDNQLVLKFNTIVLASNASIITETKFVWWGFEEIKKNWLDKKSNRHSGTGWWGREGDTEVLQEGGWRAERNQRDNEEEEERGKELKKRHFNFMYKIVVQKALKWVMLKSVFLKKKTYFFPYFLYICSKI